MDALFIGRFQPFHKGHLALIEEIAKEADRIFLVIGSSQEANTKDNPFTLAERKEMLEKSLAKDLDYRIHEISDIPDDVLWAKTIFKITNLDPAETIVFTGNPWTQKCFETIKVKVRFHPLFFDDLSSSQIRERIREEKKWKNLVPKPVYLFLKTINGEERIKNIKN